MSRRFLISSVALLGLLAFATGAARADVNGHVATWQTAWNGVSDYSVDVSSHVVKSGKVENRTYRFWYKKPMFIRLDVLAGTRYGDPGSVAVYTGTGKVVGHQGPPLTGINLALPLDDPKTTSIRGGRITDLVFNKQLSVIRKHQTAGSRIEIGAAAVVNGHAATPIVCFSRNPAFITLNEDVAKDVVFYDNATGMPLEWDRYESDGQQVVKITWTNLRTNVGLQESLFDARAKMPR